LQKVAALQPISRQCEEPEQPTAESEFGRSNGHDALGLFAGDAEKGAKVPRNRRGRIPSKRKQPPQDAETLPLLPSEKADEYSQAGFCFEGRNHSAHSIIQRTAASFRLPEHRFGWACWCQLAGSWNTTRSSSRKNGPSAVARSAALQRRPCGGSLKRRGIVDGEGQPSGSHGRKMSCRGNSSLPK
jgi:hypothetical protein